MDKVVAHSGVSKPTLYTHFRSKDELLVAVLEMRHVERMISLNDWVSKHSTTSGEALLSIFDWLYERYSSDSSRGCAFVKATAEMSDPNHIANQVSRRHKLEVRQLIADIAHRDALPNYASLASDLMILMDGTSTRVLVESDVAIALQAKRLAGWIIENYKNQASDE